MVIQQEITSPFDGVVMELLVQEGEVAKVGSTLCLIEVTKDAITGVDPSVAEPLQTSSKDTNPAPIQESISREEKPRSTLPTSNKHPMDPRGSPDAKSSSPVLAAPSVRRFARQTGVDLSQLAPGSGRDGRVEKRDVDEYLAGTTAVPLQADGHDVVVELGRTRYGMWKAMEKVRV